MPALICRLPSTITVIKKSSTQSALGSYLEPNISTRPGPSQHTVEGSAPHDAVHTMHHSHHQPSYAESLELRQPHCPPHHPPQFPPQPLSQASFGFPPYSHPQVRPETLLPPMEAPTLQQEPHQGILCTPRRMQHWQPLRSSVAAPLLWWELHPGGLSSANTALPVPGPASASCDLRDDCQMLSLFCSHVVARGLGKGSAHSKNSYR